MWRSTSPRAILRRGLVGLGYMAYNLRPFGSFWFNNLRVEFPMTTVSTKPADVRRDWFVVDADGKTLGRLATEIARRLRGKHKPEYTPHVDTGDYIVVVNAEKVRVTGNKMKNKMYHHHTGYIGNLKSISLEKLLEKAPERVIETAVRGMMPKGPLGRAMFKKLRVYAGPEHQHSAQQPRALEI